MQRAIPWDRPFFFFSSAAAPVYHRASGGGDESGSLRPLCIPFRFVSHEPIKFLYDETHTHRQRYNKPGNRPLTKCLKITDNRARGNDCRSNYNRIPKASFCYPQNIPGKRICILLKSFNIAQSRIYLISSILKQVFLNFTTCLIELTNRNLRTPCILGKQIKRSYCISYQGTWRCVR